MSDKAKAPVFGNGGIKAFEINNFSWQKRVSMLFCCIRGRGFGLRCGVVGLGVAAAACGLDDVEHHTSHDGKKILHRAESL